MKRLLLLKFSLLLCVFAMANTITVKNLDELKAANKVGKPGDTILLHNGEWKDVVIALNCNGTKDLPVTFKAQEAGKVLITGHSQLKLGGSFIVIDGFYFTNGYAGDDAIIDFRIDKKQLANHCRITNCVINDFNNLKRMDENYWVSLSGKNNRIDHCSFLNKKNMGVLMAVILDDERSRENFHSIDHNYFGVRLPLASNSGEIIRVGVSQHCEFNSNTQIVDNFFEHCDGETEIISIKSCSNVVRNNFFKECQGGVVLRHGNYNTVESNIFWGNDKEGTGGVRIINKGQWVVNNLFYKCRGVGFRSSLSIMNGVPNSPAFRYVAVTDAVIANNSFFNCTPISFCEGSDTERTVVPEKVFFANNIFYNTKDKIIYNSYDDISKIYFSQNIVSKSITQSITAGFIKYPIAVWKSILIQIPEVYAEQVKKMPDSLLLLSKGRLSGRFSNMPGLSNKQVINETELLNIVYAGAEWFKRLSVKTPATPIEVDCKDGLSLKTALDKAGENLLIIHLTGDSYKLEGPLSIKGNVTITSGKKQISFISSIEDPLTYLLEIKGGNALYLKNINLDLSGLHAAAFITADLSGSSNHSNLSISGSTIKSMNGIFFNAAKSTVFDSIIVSNNSFFSNKGTLFNFSNETDKKGLYNVEHLKMTNNFFNVNEGVLLDMLRGGNDESTMGPLLLFKNNIIDNCRSGGDKPLIILNGTQQSVIEYNRFVASNDGASIIQYEDAVRAAHFFRNNVLTKSGKVTSNKFVTEKNNTIK